MMVWVNFLTPQVDEDSQDHSEILPGRPQVPRVLINDQ